MTANVGTVSTMCGTVSSGDNASPANCFSGIFDGQGHTLNVSISDSNQGAAPFRSINNATIKNLKVIGNVSHGNHHGSGLVGFAKDGSSNLIENCHVSANVTGTANNRYNGGIVGHVKMATVTLNGCIYDGQITSNSSSNVGGLIGWGDSGHEVHLSDCLFNGTKSGSSNNFHPIGCCSGPSSSSTVTNCYYYATNSVSGQIADDHNNSIVKSTTGKGKRAYSITGASPVTVANAGTATTYGGDNVTHYITGYGTGIKYNDVLYAGDGDQVSLTLSGANTYEADHGTLMGSGSSYTLDMTANNTVISGKCTVTASAYQNSWGMVQFVNGTASQEVTQTFNAGSEVSLYAEPAQGYQFVNWTENDVEVGTAQTYIISNLVTNHTLVAHFEPIIETFTKEITGHGGNAGRWYLITSPHNTAIAPTEVTNMIPTTAADYDLFYFDQDPTDHKEWITYKAGEGATNAGFSLEAGKGYLYANRNTVTLTFTGMPYQVMEKLPSPLTAVTDGPAGTSWATPSVRKPISTATITG